jgi:hypothetical protein
MRIALPVLCLLMMRIQMMNFLGGQGPTSVSRMEVGTPLTEQNLSKMLVEGREELFSLENIENAQTRTRNSL